MLWRSQIIPTVRAYNMEAFLFGTTSPPINDSSNSSATSVNSEVNPEYLQWIRLDQFLLGWILSSISESMLGHVVNCTTSEIWKILDQLFSTKSKARVLHLRFLLQTTERGSMAVEDYILKMRSLAHESMLAGQQVSDDDLVLYVLGG